MAAPLFWIKKLSAEIPELSPIPLFGHAPAFDWARLSSLLKEKFSLSSLAIRLGEQSWRTLEEMRKGLDKQALLSSFTISPMGQVYWMMSPEDVRKLTSWLLKPHKESHSLTSSLLQEGFYRFLQLECLDILQKLKPLASLTLHLGEEETPLEEKMFCLDIEIQGEKNSCWGRLAIPASFRTAWIHHFEKTPSEYVPSDLTRQLEITLGIKTGSALLSQSDWHSLQGGDFLALDRGSYDPRHQTGAALLCLGSTPLFNVKIHQNKLNLIDYAFYHEENMQQKSGQPSSPPSSSAEEEAVSIKELPLLVTVEIARLKITLDRLMHLNPGNTLELPIDPDQSVSLTINGQKVGRAELVHLGETLGIRILEIG